MHKPTTTRVVVLAVLSLGAAYAIWTMIERSRQDVWLEAYGRAFSLYAERHNAEAAEALLPVMPQVEKWWPDSPRQFQALVFLGGCYRAAHNYEAADPLFKRALVLSEKLPSPDPEWMGRLKLDLALIARDELDTVEAERLFRESYEIFAKHPEHAYGDDAVDLLNIAVFRVNEGRYDEAESYLTRSIALYQATIFFAHEDLASAYFQLADVYRREHRYAEAETQYLNSLKLCEQMNGKTGDFHEERVLAGLALVASAQGKTANAAEFLRRAEQMSTSLEEATPADAALRLNNLGLLAINQHDYTQAETYFLQACGKYEQAGNAQDANRSIVLENLANLYRDQKQFDIHKAEPLYKQALEIRTRQFGIAHLETARTLSDMSLLNFYEQNLQASKDLAQRALPAEEKALGPDSSEVATTLNRLGISERDLGELSEAERNLSRALSIREKKLSPNHTGIAIVLENLASVYFAEGQTDKASQLAERARAIYAHPSNVD